EAGWLHPPALCRLLATHPNIRLLPHQDAVELRRDGDRWQALDGERLLAEAPVAILAGAAAVARCPQAAGLPLKRIRGQLTRLPASAESRALRTVVCAEGYVAPPRNGEHTLGASFDFVGSEPIPTVAEHVSNLALLEEISAD